MNDNTQTDDTIGCCGVCLEHDETVRDMLHTTLEHFQEDVDETELR